MPATMNKKLKLLCWGLFLFIASHKIAGNSGVTYSLERENKIPCHYYFDVSNTHENFSILLLLQGSETTSAFRLRKIIDSSWLKEFNVAVLIIEKPGVTDTTFNQQTYLQYNSLTQRADDCKMVVDHIRNTQTKWNRKLLLCGGSEGATLAAFLGPQILETQAIIMLAGGCGMTLRDEIMLLEAKNTPQGIINFCWQYVKLTYMKTMLDVSKLFPNSTYTAIGPTNSLKYWNSIADYNPLYTLEKLDIPLYLAHGAMDTNCPIESAEILATHFKTIGKDNLFYRRYEGYDHHFNDDEGMNHMGEIFGEALGWAELFLG